MDSLAEVLRDAEVAKTKGTRRTLRRTQSVAGTTGTSLWQSAQKARQLPAAPGSPLSARAHVKVASAPSRTEAPSGTTVAVPSGGQRVPLTYVCAAQGAAARGRATAWVQEREQYELGRLRTRNCRLCAAHSCARFVRDAQRPTRLQRELRVQPRDVGLYDDVLRICTLARRGERGIPSRRQGNGGQGQAAAGTLERRAPLTASAASDLHRAHGNPHAFLIGSSLKQPHSCIS